MLSDTRVLDVLLHNSDRHSGHFLFGRHWTEGGPDESESDGSASLGGSEWRPALIDHAASFRKEAFVSMEHENAFAQTGRRRASRRTRIFDCGSSTPPP